ncbi:hypothetical protein HAW55_000306 [Listeria monocytogenes]|nr:hypothetical protein [Listeria monocytogenes]
MSSKVYKALGAFLLIFSIWFNWHLYTESKTLEKEIKKEEKNTKKWKEAYDKEKLLSKVEKDSNLKEDTNVQLAKESTFQQKNVIEEQLKWNKEALRALFSYKNLDAREKNLTYYITKTQKEKMERAKSDSDNAGGGASLQSQSSFYQSLNEDSFSTWNIIEVEMEVEGVKTKVNLLANLTFVLEEGKWLLNDMKFQENK